MRLIKRTPNKKPKGRHRLLFVKSGSYETTGITTSMGIGEATGQNIGENTGSSGAPYIPVSEDHFFPNGDMNWLNPDITALTPITAGLIYNNQVSKTYSKYKIEGGTTTGMQFLNCNTIVIDNCYFKDIRQAGNIINIDNASASIFALYFYKCKNIIIRNCYFEGIEDLAIKITNGEGTGLDGQTTNITIWNCWFERNGKAITMHNIDSAQNMEVGYNFCNDLRSRTYSNGTNNFLEYRYSQPLGLWVHHNVMRGDRTTSSVEDWINPYRSSGQASSPIIVEHNMVYGSGTSRSGGGFLASDMGTDSNTQCQYTTLRFNRLVDPGQYGLGITCGNDNVIEDNEVYTSQDYADYGTSSFSNVGIYVWRIGDAPGEMYGCTVQRNKVLWYQTWNGTQVVTPRYNSYWRPNTAWNGSSPNHGTLAQGNVAPTGESNNSWDYAPWENNAGYAALPVPSTWTYQEYTG